MEGMGRRGRRDKQLLDDLNEKRGDCKLKEEAQTGTLWRIALGEVMDLSQDRLLLEALQLQRSFGLLNEFLPFDPVSDAVFPVYYFHPCYIALYIILPSIFRSS
jgi:hypothetical protein